MKLTKRQLKRIIREEKAKILNETTTQEQYDISALVVDHLIQYGAIATIDDSYESQPDYLDAIGYLQEVIIPILEELSREQTQGLQEGWLDTFKSKAWGTVKGDKKGMGQLDFTAKARKRFSQKLEDMAVEMEKDTARMEFSDDDIAMDELEEIPAILRQAAEKIGDLDDIVKAKKAAKQTM